MADQSIVEEKPRRPLVRYHGGKWKLAEWIISHFPKHRIYVEPFGGGGSVLLQKDRCYAEVYNDLHGEMVNLFRVIRDAPDDLIRAIAWTPFSRDEYLAAAHDSTDEIEQARRTIVRSFMGFGSNSINKAAKSGFRANCKRTGTTPAHDWASLPVNMVNVARRMRGVVLENRDACEVMVCHDSEETLHYVDPPYMPDTRSNCTGYVCDLTVEDHVRVIRCVKELRGMVILSGYHSEMYTDLLTGWTVIERKTFADGAAARVEVLWMNKAAATRLRDESRTLF